MKLQPLVIEELRGGGAGPIWSQKIFREAEMELRKRYSADVQS